MGLKKCFEKNKESEKTKPPLPCPKDAMLIFSLSPVAVRTRADYIAARGAGAAYGAAARWYGAVWPLY